MSFFFNETATTESYTYLHTLSLHDALPISLADIAGINRANHKTIGALLQGAPFTRAVSIKTGDKESAIIQQVDIRCAIALIEGAVRHEFVNTSRRAVIAHRSEERSVGKECVSTCKPRW